MKMPKELVGKKCERCGEQAFTAIRDTVRELTPGSLQVRFRPDGPIRWFCLKHGRDSANRDEVVLGHSEEQNQIVCGDSRGSGGGGGMKDAEGRELKVGDEIAYASRRKLRMGTVESMEGGKLGVVWGEATDRRCPPRSFLRRSECIFRVRYPDTIYRYLMSIFGQQSHWTADEAAEAVSTFLTANKMLHRQR